MLGLTSDMRFRLYVPPCDMRKGFNGLEALVANDMQEPPMSGAVYVFLNRRYLPPKSVNNFCEKP